MLKTEFFVSNAYPFQKQTTGSFDGHHDAIAEVKKKRNEFIDEQSSLIEVIESEELDFKVLPHQHISQTYIIAIITVSYYLKNK